MCGAKTLPSNLQSRWENKQPKQKQTSRGTTNHQIAASQRYPNQGKSLPLAPGLSSNGSFPTKLVDTRFMEPRKAGSVKGGLSRSELGRMRRDVLSLATSREVAEVASSISLVVVAP